MFGFDFGDQWQKLGHLGESMGSDSKVLQLAMLETRAVIKTYEYTTSAIQIIPLTQGPTSSSSTAPLIVSNIQLVSTIMLLLGVASSTISSGRTGALEILWWES